MLLLPCVEVSAAQGDSWTFNTGAWKATRSLHLAVPDSDTYIDGNIISGTDYVDGSITQTGEYNQNVDITIKDSSKSVHFKADNNTGVVYSVRVSNSYTMTLNNGTFPGMSIKNAYVFNAHRVTKEQIFDVSVGTASGYMCAHEMYVNVGGTKYSMGEAEYVEVNVNGIAVSQVTFVDESEWEIYVPTNISGGYVSVDVGFNYANGINLFITDLGVFNDDSNVVGAVNSGTASQDKGNEIAQEGNQLQEEGNQLQEEANETSKNIFDKISEFFAGFFDGIINALKSVFVPEDGYFEDFFARLNDFFAEKLGMLYAPIDLFITLLTSISGASGVNAGIAFPGLQWEGTYIIEPATINLDTIAGDFPELQDKIYFVTDIIMVGAVLLLLQHKLKEVLTN